MERDTILEEKSVFKVFALCLHCGNKIIKELRVRASRSTASKTNKIMLQDQISSNSKLYNIPHETSPSCKAKQSLWIRGVKHKAQLGWGVWWSPQLLSRVSSNKGCKLWSYFTSVLIKIVDVWMKVMLGDESAQVKQMMLKLSSSAVLITQRWLKITSTFL